MNQASQTENGIMPRITLIAVEHISQFSGQETLGIIEPDTASAWRIRIPFETFRSPGDRLSSLSITSQATVHEQCAALSETDLNTVMLVDRGSAFDVMITAALAGIQVDLIDPSIPWLAEGLALECAAGS